MSTRLLLIASLLLAAISVSYIDIETAMEQRVRALIVEHHWQGTYKKLGGGWYEFTGDDGLTWKRNFGDIRTHSGLQPKKIITIDLRKLDTTGYGVYLQEVGRVHLGVARVTPVGSRLGNDGLCELTGQYYEVGGFGDRNRMLRRKPGTYEFEFVSIIHEVFRVIGSVDMDLDGIPDILGDSSGTVLDFEAPVHGSRNISLQRTWVGMAGVLQVPRFEDLDNDRYPEVLMYQFWLGLHGVAIVKYRQETKRLEKVFEYTYPNNHDIRSCWAIGDFDKDGHKEFVTATNEGEVCFLENSTGEGDYRLSFVDTTRYMNVGVYTEGNDLDGDGRSECLVGSNNTFGLTNIAVYETLGDNSYEVTCWIEVFPVASLTWELLWTGDIDGDGKDEIVLSSGSTLVVFRAFGIADYRAVWYRNFSSEISHRLFDIDNDGTQEILLSFVQDKVHQTMILKHPVAVGVKDVPIPPDQLECSISPQPASGIQNTVLQISGSGTIHMSVRSMDGRELFTQTIEASPGGRHTIPLLMEGYPSGVYFVVLTTGDETVVKKFQVFR
jgi:hypothetical protein